MLRKLADSLAACSGGAARSEEALGHVTAELRKRRKRFALVSGLAVSVRGEVRTTRDVDRAVAVTDDAELESLVADLEKGDYRPVATVEEEARKRLSVVRLESPMVFRVDLLAASCGIEPEIVAAATPIAFDLIGSVPVARGESHTRLEKLALAIDGETRIYSPRAAATSSSRRSCRVSRTS